MRVVEALLLYDQPLMDQRFTSLVSQVAPREIAAKLERIPILARESARVAREGAQAWERKGPPDAEEFNEWADRAVLESMLTLAEGELRLAAQLARNAPDAATRAPFDRMCETQREIARSLREALEASKDPRAAMPLHRRLVQEEDLQGDLPTQLEEAVRQAEASPAGVHRVALSPLALRHLRDQGRLKHGETRLRGHPVVLDFGWEAPAFAIETDERMMLHELVRTESRRS